MKKITLKNSNTPGFIDRSENPAEAKRVKDNFYTPVFMIRVFLLLIVISFLSGCFPGIKEDITKFNSLEKLRSVNHPLFTDDFDYRDLSLSIDRSIEYFQKVPPRKKYQYGKEIYTASHLMLSLESFREFLLKQPSAKALNKFIKSKFAVYTASGNQEKQVLFTGYFEPIYPGSLKKSDLYKYPVYAAPGDLFEIDLSRFSGKYENHKRLMARVNHLNNTVLPYYSRKQINAMEDFKAEPVAWLKSRVDRFFLEIQGSGRIMLEGEKVLRLHYAKSNGNSYKSIGRYLIDKKEILKKDMSMQAIRNWLEQNPHRMDEVLHHNGSFVFFQVEEGGPFGCLGVEVTALRSIATDINLFPKGALCFIQSRLPEKADSRVDEWKKTSFFALNQDTGGAIKGPARADIFCGHGEYAEFAAGHMNQYGKLFFLVLNP